MKPLLLVYNPFAGDHAFARQLDAVVDTFQQAGYSITLARLGGDVDLDDLFTLPYDAIAVSGGDGTINNVAGAMLSHGISIPMCVIPAGTANDLAAFFGLPTDPAEAAAIIADGRLVNIDAGLVNNERYFINVFEAGALANISQSVDGFAKSAFGKMAYYIKGVETLANLSPLSVRVTYLNGKNVQTTITEDVYVIVVLNSSGAGGFADLSPEASVNDGLFDFVAVKAIPAIDLAALFLKILMKDYLNDPGIVYFQSGYIAIEPLFDYAAGQLSTDMDGEAGVPLPVKIANAHNALKIFVPK